MKKIAVYGGSFDPPHKGHRLLAENLAEKCGADKVVVIPTALSPFKDSSSASPEERLEMCRLAFDGELFEVSDIEIKRGGKSYTVDTLAEVKKSYPNSQLYLFMGDDMFLSFDKWYRYEDIMKLAVIVCACRTENRDKLEKMQAFCKNTLNCDENGVIISDCVPLEISSTELRALKGEKMKEYLNEKVYNYIVARGLYDCD